MTEDIFNNMWHVRVFLSTPMNGKKTGDINKRVAAVTEIVKEKFPSKAITVSTGKFSDTSKVHPMKALGESIKSMGDFDLVVFDYNWSSARGCKIEHDVCEAYGKPFAVIVREGLVFHER